MADTKDTIKQLDQPHQMMQHERAKAEVGDQGEDEKARLERERQEIGVFGGGETRSQTGEPGRSRNELDQNRRDPAGQQR